MWTQDCYRTSLRFARGVANLAPQLLTRVHATVRENHRLVFGRVDEELIRRTYRHFCEAMVDIGYYRLLFDPDRFEEHFLFDGDAIRHYRRSGGGGGAILVSGHFGNWELLGAAFEHLGVQLAPIVRPQGTNWFARRLQYFRARQGQHQIAKDNALPLAMKAIRAGLCVAFLVDQAAGRHGIKLPFLGMPAYTHLTPALLAKKLNVPIYAGYSTRIGDGIRYRCWAERVSTEGDVETVTRRINRILEGYILSRPDQWWWFHKRFKWPKDLRRGRLETPAGIPVDA